MRKFVVFTFGGTILINTTKPISRLEHFHISACRKIVEWVHSFTEVSDQAPPQFGYVISPLVTTSIEVGVFLTVAEAWKEIYAILDVSDATDAECHAIIAEIRAAMEKANEKPDVPLDRVVGMMKGVEGYGEEEASRD